MHHNANANNCQTQTVSAMSDARSCIRSGSVRNATSATPAAATSAAATGRSSKMVRISSIDNPVDQLRDLKSRDTHRASASPSEHRSDAFDQIALLYAMCLTLFGFVFPLSNYVSINPGSPWYLFTFYILLHMVSLAFLAFLLGWVMQQPAQSLFVPTEQRKGIERYRAAIKRSKYQAAGVVFHLGSHDHVDLPDNQKELATTALLPTVVTTDVTDAHIQLQEPGTTLDSAEDDDDDESQLDSDGDVALKAAAAADSASLASTNRGSAWAGVSTAPSEAASSIIAGASNARRRRGYRDRINSTMLQNARELGVHEIPAYSVLSLQESHSPSFFHRIACFIFGALKITHELLMIVDTVAGVRGGCAKSNSEAAGVLVQYGLSICFTVVQTFFIFKYSKVSVNIYRKHCVLGFMHLVASNMCIWFQAILLETSHSTVKTGYDINYNISSSSRNSNSNSSSNYTYTARTASAATSSCYKDVFWRMAPYLFPFTIEYALMAAFSNFSLYRNVSVFLDLIQTKGFNVASKCLQTRKKAQTSFSASCYKTDKGFFFGAFLLIIGFLSGIYFIVYVSDKPNDQTTSRLIFQVTDLLLLGANLVLCIVACRKMRRLTRLHTVSSGPDSWLLGVTLIGVLAFQFFQLFGASADSAAFLSIRVAQGLLAITQSIVQVALVIDSEKRRSKTPAAIEEKPGREAIAAVLLGNIALWVVYTLEIREVNNLPNYNHAYVSVASSIFTYVCSPLIIFFRFHSACCFVEIWRTAYQSKKEKRDRCQSHPELSPCVNTASSQALSGTIHGLTAVTHV